MLNDNFLCVFKYTIGISVKYHKGTWSEVDGEDSPSDFWTLTVSSCQKYILLCDPVHVSFIQPKEKLYHLAFLHMIYSDIFYFILYFSIIKSMLAMICKIDFMTHLSITYHSFKKLAYRISNFIHSGNEMQILCINFMRI